MKEEHMYRLLQHVAQGKMSVEEALEQSRLTPLTDLLEGLNLDYHRELRTGIGEVVFAQNKSDTQLVSAMEHLSRGFVAQDVESSTPIQKNISAQAEALSRNSVLATRVSPEQTTLLCTRFPQGFAFPGARLFSLGKTCVIKVWPTEGEVLVLSAGAADSAVALEAVGTLHFWGVNVGYIADVGVAGLHRLTPHVPALSKARIIIAVAGMEGALPGVIAGFVRCPVLAVPTSVGYGIGEGGHAALSTMLCTCVPGVAVLNIDNGFGAAAFAAKYIRHG